MKSRYRFNVADLLFEVSLLEEWSLDKLLPSFRPFISNDFSGESVFSVNLLNCLLSTDEPEALIEESVNDLGHMRLFKSKNGYRITFSYTEIEHEMRTDLKFIRAYAFVNPSDPYKGLVLTSMLRVMFSMALIRRNGISIHSSCVTMKDKAFLFLGKSGTGKSTHSRQWLKAFPDCVLLNDDNPALRLVNGGIIAYGTPWSGKTPCYKNEHHPVKAIVKLSQAPENQFKEMEDIAAFTTLLPSCSGIRQDEELRRMLHETLIAVSMSVVVGKMDCLPNEDAARVCFDGITSSSKK